MKITNDTTAYQIAELMGNTADEHDGMLMFSLLSHECITDTDELTADQWLKMIDEVSRIRQAEETYLKYSFE